MAMPFLLRKWGENAAATEIMSSCLKFCRSIDKAVKTLRYTTLNFAAIAAKPCV
ncbi:hypothetical protein GEI7407_2240 [Geitlerinema sp. PCC 7407]|nr:hypothetical protein GEI7407_2240 [Geitlerinema sp. PCC 7407]